MPRAVSGVGVSQSTGMAEAVTTPLSGVARTAARRMVAAWEAPVFHLGMDVDMTAALAAKGDGVTVSDLIVEACAAALVAHPAVNAHYADEAITVHSAVNVGLAVDTPKGLMVPVIHGADALGRAGIAVARKDIVERAHAGALKMPDISGGTFTVSNLGMLGIDAFDAILNVPQVAILAVGATRSVPRESIDGILWLPQARFTLTCDHRALDGATGARFLGTVRDVLEGMR